MIRIVGALIALLGAATAQGLDRSVTVGDSRITVQFAESDFALGIDEITAWVGRRAAIVRNYYGRFPVDSAVLRIRATPGGGVHGGREFSAASPFINIAVGRNATRAELDDDWVLVHEMIHLAFPEIGDEHAWLAEGLAVYVEGVARTQAGNETPEELWAGLMNDMPQGEPRAGDEGLDQTHTWGRTYWGGAIFCLQADVLIRERTANHKGLRDALREVLRLTGGNTEEMSIGRALSIGDAATGTTVLTELYGAHAFTPKPFDLEAIWQKLGIAKRDGHIVFDDNAPLAAVRRAITRS